MIPPLGDIWPETRHLNFEWTVADADRITAMAAAGKMAGAIATALDRTEADILWFCDQNGIFVRRRARGAS